MVGVLKDFGWAKSALLIFGLIGAIWAAEDHIDTRVSRKVDDKVRVHALEAAEQMNDQLRDIKTKQAIMDAKVDMILERLPK